MRIVFLGTPGDGVPPLQALVEAGHEIALVVTQPDRRRGRGSALVASPVKAAAVALGLSVSTPQRADEIVDDVRATGAALGVVVAFGQLLRPAFIDAFPLGCINVHFSLLPRWRGAAPVERAVLAGDVETGVCIMRLEAGLDTGPVYARVATPIGAHESAGALRERLVELGTQLLVETITRVPDTTPMPQEGEPTYAKKLEVTEFELDPARSASELDRIVRAGNPRPGAWIALDGGRLKVLEAHVDGDRLVPDIVQPEGKRPMSFAAWRTGHRGDVPF